MIRTVIDTNIFISSFFCGSPQKIIHLWKSGEILLCLSGPIMDEYIAVLSRMGFKEEAELDELLRFFARGFHTLYTTNTPKLDIVEKDPDDNKFIECAVALKAGLIISGDKVLQKINEYMGIKILNLKQFLDYYPVL